MTDRPTPSVHDITLTRNQHIKVGDRVMYSAEFCRNTGQQTGDTPFARGVVTALVPLGETTLAEVDWGNEDMPRRVNTANLETSKEKQR